MAVQIHNFQCFFEHLISLIDYKTKYDKAGAQRKNDETTEFVNKSVACVILNIKWCSKSELTRLHPTLGI